MLLWLLIALAPNSQTQALALELVPSAQAVETANGPTSQQEADILWTDGQKYFDAGKYQDSVNSLSRLVDRYPGATGYLEAHRLLGRSLMMLGRYSEAAPLFESYINATGNRELGLSTRLWLGETYLQIGKANEAYLSSQEIEKATQLSKSDIYARSQFLKARALLALDRDERAQRVIDSVESLPIVQSDSALKGYAAQARIDLKLRSCRGYPSAGAMDEQQARDQFSRRALCLQEALVLFKTAAESRELGTGDQTATELYKGFESYTTATRKPPPPTKLTPVDRTPQQRAEYAAELIAKLNEDRKKALQESLSIISEWRSKSSPKAAIAYTKLTKEIEKLL
jgi:tetratricopeptide (TPR) repeat protein